MAHVTPAARPRCRGLLQALGAALMLVVLAARVHAADPALSMTHAGQTAVLTLAELKLLPRAELTAVDPHLKASHHYSGVAVRDLLAKVGAPLGERLRGPALQLAVVVRSRDGYATLFALAEFDDSFSERTLILADSEDGAPLPASAGPLRLVAAGDKRAARWARMVTSIEVVRLPDKPLSP